MVPVFHYYSTSICTIIRYVHLGKVAIGTLKVPMVMGCQWVLVKSWTWKSVWRYMCYFPLVTI